MPIAIRMASPEDAPGLMRLNTAFNGPGTQTVEGIKAALETPGAELVLVAEAAGEPIAFCCCQLKYSFCYGEPSGEITEFYVDPGYRRQGVGRRLLQAAIGQCKARGAGEITLLTGDDNYAAQALYASGGFAPSGELHMELQQ